MGRILKCTVNNTFVVGGIVNVPDNSWSMTYNEYNDDSPQNPGKTFFSVNASNFFVSLKLDVRRQFNCSVNLLVEVHKKD